jgi:hypothetical protein
VLAGCPSPAAGTSIPRTGGGSPFRSISRPPSEGFSYSVNYSLVWQPATQWNLGSGYVLLLGQDFPGTDSFLTSGSYLPDMNLFLTPGPYLPSGLFSTSLFRALFPGFPLAGLLCISEGVTFPRREGEVNVVRAIGLE